MRRASYGWAPVFFLLLPMALPPTWVQAHVRKKSTLKLQQQQDPLEGTGPLPAGVDGLLIAITRDKLTKFKEFLNKAPNPRELANGRTSFGDPYLMQAAAYGRPEMVRYLLELGADPDIRRKGDNKTSLIITTLLGYVQVMNVLLEPGAGWQADVDAVDEQGMTALMYGASMPQADVSRTLLRHGASTSLKQRRTGMTALMYAAFNGHVETMRAVVEDGNADVEQRDDYGKTALMWAAMGKHVKALRYLVGKGADRLAVDNLGLSAADYQRFAPDPKDAERKYSEGHFSKWQARNRLTAEGEL